MSQPVEDTEKCNVKNAGDTVYIDESVDEGEPELTKHLDDKTVNNDDDENEDSHQVCNHCHCLLYFNSQESLLQIYRFCVFIPC